MQCGDVFMYHRVSLMHYNGACIHTGSGIRSFRKAPYSRSFLEAPYSQLFKCSQVWFVIIPTGMYLLPPLQQPVVVQRTADSRTFVLNVSLGIRCTQAIITITHVWLNSLCCRFR